MSYPPTGPDGTPPPADPPPPPPGAGHGYPTAGGPAYQAPAGTPPGHVPPAPAPGYAAPAVDPFPTPVTGVPAPAGYEPSFSVPPAPGAPASGPPVPGQQPYPGAPMSAPPMSAPPYGQPMSGQPSFGPPMSAPPYGQPMSAPPGSGVPYGVPPVPGAGGGKGRNVLVLAVVAGLLFVLGGVMTGLFVAKSSQANRTERQLTAQVADRDDTIAANGKEIEGLKRDLQAATDKVNSTEQDLAGTKNDRDEQQRQKEVIGKCLDQLNAALAAAAAKNKAAFDQASKGLDQVCNEAEKYL